MKLRGVNRFVVKAEGLIFNAIGGSEQNRASGQFIDDAEDVVIIGPIGTGKTHLAIALGVLGAAGAPGLGALQPRGETRMLSAPIAQLMRLRHNPFYEYLESRTVAWMKRAGENQSTVGETGN